MKVLPKNEQMRAALRHPSAGAFPTEGPADWPDDSFTTRRIRDGDVTVQAEEKPQQPKMAKAPKGE